MLLPPHVVVSATIKLDGKARFRAIEIEDIAINRMLSPKFVIREIPIAQMAPENSLRLGRVFTQVTSAAHKIIVYFRSFGCKRQNRLGRDPINPLTSILSPQSGRGGSTFSFARSRAPYLR